MEEDCLSRNQEKLVIKLSLEKILQNSQSRLKEMNFSRYNRKLYLDNYKTFRNTRTKIFKKHNNLVETNKENIMKLNISKNKDGLNAGSKYLQKVVSQTIFAPKRQGEIISKRCKEASQQLTMAQMNSANLQGLLRKNKMKTTRNLLGFNILKLERKYNFSRFQLHTLHSIFNTLLAASKDSIKQFKDNFQVMLNMNKITIRPEVLDKIFKEQESISFQKFIEMYGKIDKVIFKQNIIDYVEILFEGIYNKDHVRFEDIVRIFKNRITQKESIDVAKTIYEQYDRNFEHPIKLSEITELCHCCQNFAKKMYRIYTSELKCD